MTPQRVYAFLDLAEERKRGEMVRSLTVTILGTHGDKPAVEKALREWS